MAKNIEFEKVHDIEYLVELCLDKDDSFDWMYEVARKVSEYAIEIRYPDEFYIPTLEEAKECFEIATKVKKFILKKLKITDEELKNVR